MRGAEKEAESGLRHPDKCANYIRFQAPLGALVHIQRQLAGIGSGADFDWSPVVGKRVERIAMSTRRRFKQVTSLKDRLLQEAENLRKQAAEMPHCALREDILRKARQAETGARMDDWLASPGLRSPE
jgi:hypothetical protein